MKNTLKALATLALTAAMATGFAQTAASSPSTPKRVHRKPAPKGPSVQAQIEELRQQQQADHGQIDTLKQQLADRDAQLQQAQQAAAAAQAAAQQAQQAANSEQQTLSANSEAVSSLQSSVTDLKANSVSIASTLQQQQADVKKAIESPDALHYKGITISPAGSFIEAATVYRSAATGGDINTPFTSIPLQSSDASNVSEFFGSGRQSRIAIKAEGKLANATMTGYYELDWLGTGITSNNNQSNSYVVRQRQIWARAAFASGWNISAGQMWSLATETTHGLDNGTEILPGTIDPQYTAGFVWTRQYGFRVAKDFGNKAWLGFSAENAETLNPGGTIAASTTPIVLGTGGTGGGLYNSTANYSFNEAPDVVAKMAFEPGWGHWEVFGVGRFFRDRIYPTGGTPYNDSRVGGGIGGGFRVPMAKKTITLGLKGLYGDGTGRYGDSTIADITIRPNGTIAPLHNFSALSTLELNPGKRTNIYFNYGGDYINRDIIGTNGYGLYTANMTGCNTEATPGATGANGGYGFAPGSTGTCAGNNKDVQEATSGFWYNFYNGPKGRFRMGIQYSYFNRNLWSGNGGTTNPGGNAKGVDNIVETSMRYYVP
jgi:hypothetical protein